MDTILVFSLLFASFDVNQKELKGSSCQVEEFPGLFPSDMRNIKVLLIQEPQGEAKREVPGQNQIVATLQCIGSERKVTVNLQDSEKRPKASYTLESLSVINAPLPNNLTRPHCYLFPAPKLWFQAGLHFTVQVFLPSISNCKFYPVVKALPEGLATTTSITTIAKDGEEETSSITVSHPDIDEDLLLRKKWSILVKFLIAITLLISGLAITVFVIFEVPCPCACPGVQKLCQCQQWRKWTKEGNGEQSPPGTAGGPITEESQKVGPKRTGAPSSSSPKMAAAEINVIHQTYF